MTENPTPADRAKAEAERLMSDPASGSADREHPQYEATNARVKELWRIAADASAPPPPDIPVPQLDDGDRVPTDARGYKLDPPPFEDDRVRWDRGMLDAFPAQAHAAGLTWRQAQQLLTFFTRTVVPAVAEHGEEGLDLPVFQKFADHARLLGIPDAAARRVLEWYLDTAPVAHALPPREVPPEVADAEDEQAAIMGDLTGPYYNKAHPKHQRTMDRVHQLARIITREEGTR